MDKTLINLSTILLSGTGLFAVLTRLDVPQINFSFWDGENPYAIKRDEIEKSMNWIFTSLAVIGLLLQTYGEIFVRPDKIYGSCFYVCLFLIGIAAMVLVTMALASLGRHSARKRWLPKILLNQKEVFESARFSVEHEGSQKNDWSNRENLILTPEKRAKIEANTQKILTQIEDLLEIPNASLDVKERIRIINSYFE